MRIGMVLDHPFPPDHRVEKEANSLIANGHEIHLFCFNHSTDRSYEKLNGIHIHRFNMPKKAYKKLIAIINVLPFYNSFWEKHLTKKLHELKLDALHIHDLPLSKVAVKLRKKFNIPVTIDMHEDYADWINQTPHYSTFVGKIVKKLSQWKKYEGQYLRLADNVVGVSPILIDKMIREHNVDRNKIIFVPNAPDLNFMNTELVPDDIKEKLSNRFNLIYVGGISYLRGLQNVIPTLSAIKDTIDNIQLVIVGDGTYKSELVELTRKYNLEDIVCFAGWESVQRLSAYISLAQIGLYPSLRYRGVDDKVPTKVFQYWALKKPVLASDYEFPRQLVNKFKAGYTVDYETEQEKFIELVVKLYKKPELRKEMGLNGRRAIDQEWNWDYMVKPLLKLYNTN